MIHESTQYDIPDCNNRKINLIAINESKQHMTEEKDWIKGKKALTMKESQK